MVRVLEDGRLTRARPRAQPGVWGTVQGIEAQWFGQQTAKRTRSARARAVLVVGVSLAGLGCSGALALVSDPTEAADGATPMEASSSSDGAASALDESASPPDASTVAVDSATPMEASSSSDGAASAHDDSVSTRDASTDPPFADSGGGIAAVDSTVAAAVDSAPPPPAGSYASCVAILKAAPASRSGTYVISISGETNLAVHCDMGFAGGGWTLVQSTNGGNCSPASETTGTVALGSCTYMPTVAVMALARESTTVHVRTASASAAPVAYITSATAVPIQNLQRGLILNANEPAGKASIEEAAWTVVGDPGNAIAQGRKPESILSFDCPVAGETWPGVYHASCNGTDGMAFDVGDNASLWNWSLPHVNVPMEVYVR